MTAVIVGAAVAAPAQNLPAGTRSVDDHSRENAVTARIAAAESLLEKRDYAGAEAALKTLVVDRPKDSHVWYDLGFAEERNNEPDAAMEAYGKAVEVEPAYAEAHYALAGLYAAKNRETDAHHEFEVVGAMTTASPALRGRALRVLANVDQMKGQVEAASAEMLQAIAVSGEQPGDTLMAGSLALYAKDYPAAERELVKALAENPDSVDARLGLGTALARQGKLSEAEATLQAGLKSAPNDVGLNTALAEAYSFNGKDAEALDVLDGLWKRDQNVHGNVMVESMLARLYSMNGRPTDAEPLLREVAAMDKNNPRALDDLGSALVKEAKYAEAERVLAVAFSKRAAFGDDRAWGESASHLAFAASRNKDPQAVLQALKARATVLPETPATEFLQATAYDSLHQFKDAVRLYKVFLASSGGKFPDEEFEARHRLVALQHEK